jgi:hypothetical protein
MRSIFGPSHFAAVILLSCFSLAQIPGQSADLVVVHAHIYTVNARLPWAEALAIRDIARKPRVHWSRASWRN